MPNPLDAFISKRGSIDVKLREMPKLGEYFQRNGLKDGVHRYDEAMEEWRKDLQRMLPTEEAISNSITTIVQNITNITNGGGSGSGSSFDPSAIIADVSALEDALAAHIAANVVHGTASPVVGETDEQSLEKKTIGVNFPRNAVFKHALQISEIPADESYTVTAGFNGVVAGPFDIYGELIVDGAFAVV